MMIKDYIIVFWLEMVVNFFILAPVLLMTDFYLLFRGSRKSAIILTAFIILLGLAKYQFHLYM